MSNNQIAAAVDFTTLEAKKDQYRQQFQSARPFRYVVVDQFCLPEAAQSLASQFPVKQPDWIDASGKHAKKKWTSPVVAGSDAEVFFKEVQSERFMSWLQYVTGIEGFVYDKEYFGAGFHQTTDGGYLNVHIDFNKLPNGLDRRLNLIVYMNKRWEDDWGGELELWDRENNQMLEEVKPILNRAALFETNEISYHGHPKPLNTGGQATRNSFSVYFYTKGRPSEEEAPPHSTIYINTEGEAGKQKLLRNSLHQLLTLAPIRRRLADWRRR